MAGRRIDDHSFWAGGKSKGSVFPEGAKVKHEAGVEGAGEMGDYPDTAEAIRRDQGAAVSKIKSGKMKPGYRY